MPPLLILRDAATREWCRFTNPVTVVVAYALEDVQPALAAIEDRVNHDGLHAAGFISYEAAPAFDPALKAQAAGKVPLLWFGLYEREERFVGFEGFVEFVEFGEREWEPSVTRDEYDAAFTRIREHIADGDSYQVNFTFRLRARLDAAPLAVFASLVRAQDTGYAAFIDTGPLAICSVSPELFFSLDGRTLTCRPMKGTAPRGRFVGEDLARAEWLHHSEKNRAENVMIVDMIRNDIGHVADVGSVEATQLFDVEPLPTAWQMTSTVTGQTDASVAEIVAALFPCASITGAPKARTAAIIAALESAPRGVYTGAIGMIHAGRRAQFSVAIRTVVIDTATGDAEYGVGGGVTWESDAAGEYAECLTKARVVTDRRPDFALLETIRWDMEAGYALLDRHLHRLAASAGYFARPLDIDAVRATLTRMAGAFTDAPQIVRLLVDADGEIRCESSPLVATSEPVQLALAPLPVDAADIFLFHKTTHRVVYDRARSLRPDADDVVLWNEQGEITETTIANLLVEIDGEWCTPPITCGLLAGTYRAMLIDTGQVRERVITYEELLRSPRIQVVNSVRGARPAVVWPS